MVILMVVMIVLPRIWRFVVFVLMMIHTYITICIACCVESTEYTSNQRRWRQSLGGQLLASKVISFQVALKAVQ